MIIFCRNYSPIVSQEQRQRYKNDFNREYNEYRALHARIEGVTRQFTVLEAQLRQLQQGTDQYQVSPSSHRSVAQDTGSQSVCQQQRIWSVYWPISGSGSVCLNLTCCCQSDKCYHKCCEELINIRQPTLGTGTA